jgi:hypothetical protein
MIDKKSVNMIIGLLAMLIIGFLVLIFTGVIASI